MMSFLFYFLFSEPKSRLKHVFILQEKENLSYNFRKKINKKKLVNVQRQVLLEKQTIFAFETVSVKGINLEVYQ